jgi:hypothetical protein
VAPRYPQFLAGRSGRLVPMRGHILRSPGRGLSAERDLADGWKHLQVHLNVSISIIFRLGEAVLAKFRDIVLVLSGIAILDGCAHVWVAGFSNKSEPIEDVHIQYGATDVKLGRLMPRTQAGWGAFDHIPEQAAVSWQMDSGAYAEHKVNIARSVPRDFRGTIYFRIWPDNTVDVVPVTQKEERKGSAGPSTWK